MTSLLNKVIVKYSIYLWFLRRIIGNDVSTVIDLGCGNGLFMEALSSGKKWEITGTDLFNNYLKIAKNRKIYKELIKGDIITVLKKIINQKKKYDLVFCSQVIEHLDKGKGEELLGLVEKIAIKKILISTPKGFMKQPEIFIDDNLLQHHKSGWEMADFTKRGYQVKGIGANFIWSESGWGRIKNKPVYALLTLVSYILGPVVYHFPSLAAGLIVFKNKNQVK